MLGIIGAMDVEIKKIKSHIEEPTVKTAAGCEFVTGKIGSREICAVQCSPGKVNAAQCTQAMLDNFDIDAVINIGVGCSLSKDIVIKNVVVADSVCQYDIDITAFGEEKGLINGLNIVKIPTDPELSNALINSAKQLGYSTFSGTVASGDTFIGSDKMKAQIASDFGACCGEMEGGAIGQVCYINGVKFAVLRSISDGGDESVQVDYPTFKPIAADISSKILLEIFK